MNRFFISLLLLLFITTCELPSDPTENQNPEVLEIQADYDEVTEGLYVTVSVSNYESVIFLALTQKNNSAGFV